MRLEQIGQLFKKAYVQWICVTVLFFFVTWLHMGPSLSQCSSIVLSDPGDHTAGLMYNSWISPNNPFPGFNALTNYPFGENMRNPTALSSVIPSTAHLVFSKLTNTVCGWNLIILLGYMSNALIMFAFIRWLTKNIWTALFAAYAVTFTPYHAFASWGQPAGLFGAIFILVLWQCARMWQKPSRLNALLLGAILGLSFYVDGYFILFGIVMFASFWISILGYELFWKRKKLQSLKQQITSLFIASVTAFVLLLPLAWVNHHYAAQISTYLSNIRGAARADAQIYSASPHMYFMPTERMPLVGSSAQNFQSKYFNDSGKPGLIFLGFSVIALSGAGTWWLWRQRSKKLKNAGFDTIRFVGWASAVLGFMAFWVSLKPQLSLFGLPIYNPSSLIVQLTPSWRVFGRLYMLVVIATVVLASIGLVALLKKYPGYKYLILGLCFVFLVAELRSFPSSALTGSFNYQKDTPPVYGWLKDNPEVKAIAEYPLDEIPQGSYLGDYYSFQVVSGKPILNSILPNSPQSGLRRSIAGINDPQTLPVLRALGVSLLNARPVNPKTMKPDLRQAALTNPELKQMFSFTASKHPMDSFLINPGKTASHALTIPSLQYYQVSLTEDGSANYLVGSGTSLLAIALPNTKEKPGTVQVAFEISADSPRQTTILQNGKVVWSGALHQTNQRLQFTVATGEPFTIYSQESTTPLQLFISKLQVL